MTPMIIIRRLVDPFGVAKVVYSWAIADQTTGIVRDQGKTWFTTPKGAMQEALQHTNS